MPDIVMNETPEIYRNRSTEITNLAAALCKAQGSMAGAKKDSENPHFRNAYADLASVWEAIRKPLTENGLSVVQFPCTKGNGVEIETILLHVSGEYVSNVLWVPCSKNDAQGLGSAITYGRRYALMAVTGIAPVDDDGNDATGSHKPGVPGSAGGGTDFRPPGPRRMPPTGTTNDWVGDAERDGIVDTTRQKGTLPPKYAARAQANNANAPEAQNAVKRVEWVKKAIDGFSAAQTKDELQEWWKSETERLSVIETAMPLEYERLLSAYDQAIERTAGRGT